MTDLAWHKRQLAIVETAHEIGLASVVMVEKVEKLYEADPALAREIVLIAEAANTACVAATVIIELVQRRLAVHDEEHADLL